MVIEILPDGRVKVDTGDLSGAQHMSADQFLRFLASECGGEWTTKKKLRGAVTKVAAHAGLKARG
jgi:hypothetical protein